MSALGQFARNSGIDPVQIAKDAPIKFGESSTTLPGTPPPPPPPPVPDDQAVADAGAGQKKPKGRASTVLTGNYGLLGSGSTASRTLLGY